MTLKSAIANDYLLFDGVETVTLKRRHPTVADVEGVKALQRLRSIGQAIYGQATAGIDPEACVWEFWEATMSGAAISNGDKFTRDEHDDEEWAILSADYSNQTSRYRCLAVRSRAS